MPSFTEMPLYRSHKEVAALEIEAVDYRAKGGPIVTPKDPLWHPFSVKPEVFLRYMPNPGDFYVVYSDGYESISPRKSFLEGYDRIF